MKNGCFITLLALVAVLVLSWGLTVGIVELIALCFGLKISLLMATGIWLIIWLLKSIFSSNTKSK